MGEPPDGGERQVEAGRKKVDGKIRTPALMPAPSSWPLTAGLSLTSRSQLSLLKHTRCRSAAGRFSLSLSPGQCPFPRAPDSLSLAPAAAPT